MKVNKLTISEYRNLAMQTLTLDSGLNVFVGNNAQGKTNLLESVYLCCLGKSPRTDKEKEMISWNSDQAKVVTDYSSRYGDGQIAIALSRKSKKAISVNDIPVLRIGELLGYLNCVFFSPTEIKVISETPSERRHFLDIDLCQIDKAYYYSLIKFNKILAQRNNLLKTATTLSALKDMLFVWDTQLAQEGARIVLKRKNFCEQLSVFAKNAHSRLTDNEENLVVQYLTTISGATQAQLVEDYLLQLTKSIERDFQLRYTSVGCQRDDIGFTVNDIDIRAYGSQGQKRTCALSLKLAELEIFKTFCGEYPILLLDDVMSELDFKRQRQLLTFSNDLQIL
ncbi:MAG: DNA replication/repair protein RecF, partial [Clostridia bacterium]